MALGCGSRPGPKRKRKYRRSCCWNPFIVFVLTFAAIGSLRFRERKPVLPPFRRRHMHYILKTNEGSQTISKKDNKRSFQTYNVVLLSRHQEQLGANHQPTLLSYEQWIRELARGRGVKELVHLLSTTVPYSAISLELPVWSPSTANQPAEFVVLESTAQLQTVEKRAFAKHFDNGNTKEIVSVLEHQTDDATLIAPRPNQNEQTNYSHLKVFLQTAPSAQSTKTLQTAARALLNGSSPRWLLSTVDNGWVHLRIDRTPKHSQYYQSKHAKCPSSGTHSSPCDS